MLMVILKLFIKFNKSIYIYYILYYIQCIVRVLYISTDELRNQLRNEKIVQKLKVVKLLYIILYSVYRIVYCVCAHMLYMYLDMYVYVIMNTILTFT